MSSKRQAASNTRRGSISYELWIGLGALLTGYLASAAVERRSAQALLHERRRVAADVHDLIMQDLSLALSNARALAGEGDEGTHRASLVVSAGERALAGARGVVGGLTGEAQRESEPIVRAIEASAQAAASNTRLIFDAHDVPGSACPNRLTREALVHVAREAVRNATKHARPNAIAVTLRYTGQWRLTVRDEGEGFDVGGTGNGGFGLNSMRAHVQALGGALRVSSAAGTGTTVEAVLP